MCGSPTPSIDSDTNPPSYMSGDATWASNLRQRLFDRVIAGNAARSQSTTGEIKTPRRSNSRIVGETERNCHEGNIGNESRTLLKTDGSLRVVNGIDSRKFPT